MIEYRKRTRRKKFRRPCNKCGEMYMPSGPATKLCDKCFYECYHKNSYKRRKISKYNKQYYLKNKVKILKRRKEKYQKKKRF